MDKTYTRNSTIGAAGLAIHGAASALAKITNTVPSHIDGNIYAAVTAADLIALTGINVNAGFTHAFAVMLSTAGVYSYVQANQQPSIVANGAPTYVQIANASITGVYPVGLLPVPVPGFALVGYIIIKNASASVFTGGTTNLDATSITSTFIDAFTSI